MACKPKSQLRMSDGGTLMKRFASRQPGLRMLDGGMFVPGENQGGANTQMYGRMSAALAPPAPPTQPATTPLAAAQPVGQAPSSWQAQTDLQNARTGASSIVKDASQRSSASQLAAMTAPRPIQPASVSPFPTGAAQPGSTSPFQTGVAPPTALTPPKPFGLRDGGEIRAADGFFSNLRKAVMPTDAEKAALEAYKRETSPATQQPAPAPTPTQGIGGYVSNGALQRRMQAAGLREGGDLRTGQGGAVPGTGSGDKIPAKYEPGEFVVSNAMLDAAPQLRGQLHDLRGNVLASQGKTVEQADAKALNGGKLRADSGFARNPAQLGTGAYDPSLNPTGAQDGQNQTTVAGTGPTNPGSAPSGSGSGGVSSPVTGGQGRVPRSLKDPEVPAYQSPLPGMFPSTAAKLRQGGTERSDAWDQGNYSKSAFSAVGDAVSLVPKIADDVFGGAARGAYNLLRNPVEDAGRAALGMEDRKQAAAPANSAQAATNSVASPQDPYTHSPGDATGPGMDRDLGDEFSNRSTQLRNPGGQVKKVVGADGKTSYSGGNVTGDVSLTDANGQALRGGMRGGVSVMGNAQDAERIRNLGDSMEASRKASEAEGYATQDRGVAAGLAAQERYESGLRTRNDSVKSVLGGQSRTLRGQDMQLQAAQMQNAATIAGHQLQANTSMAMNKASNENALRTTGMNNGVTREGNQMHLDAALAPAKLQAKMRAYSAQIFKAAGGDNAKAARMMQEYGLDPKQFLDTQASMTANSTAEQTQLKAAKDASSEVFKNRYTKTNKAGDEVDDPHASKISEDIASQLTKGGFGLAPRQNQADHQQTVQELTDMFRQIETPRQVGWNKAAGYVGADTKNPRLTAMPNFKGGSVKQLGKNMTLGTANNDYELTDAAGNVHYMSNMSQHQLNLLEEMGATFGKNTNALRK